MRIGGSTTCDNLFRFHCPILHVTRATASSDTSSRDFYQKMKRLLYMRHKTIMFSSQKRFNVFPPRSLSLSLLSGYLARFHVHATKMPLSLRSKKRKIYFSVSLGHFHFSAEDAASERNREALADCFLR